MMKLYLTDHSKVNSYVLPEKVEELYTITYMSSLGIQETLTLTAENGQWIISGNYDTNIFKGNSQITKEPIENNNIYTIKFSDLNEALILYCFEEPFTYYDYSIGNKDKIILSREGNYDILYDNVYISSPHFSIYRYNNNWILEDNGYEGTLVYVNGYRVRRTIIHGGDVIFTNGFKLIWMGLFIRINNPNNNIRTSLESYSEFNAFGNENKYTPVKDSEKNITLYDDNQVFFHTPRVKPNFTEKNIKIENPPQKQQGDKTPVIFTLGTTVIMGLSSSITGIIAVLNIVSGKATLLTSITEVSMCFTMIIGAMLLPLMQDKWQRAQIKKHERIRQKRYGEYLNKKNKDIQDELQKETSILFQNNLSCDELTKVISSLSSTIWSREISDNDFLSFRIGLGDKKSEISIDATLEEFTLDDDNLRKEVKKIIDTPLILKSVPITVSLIENRVMSLIISPDYAYRQQYIDNIMLQLITYYSGNDLKIVILTNKDNEKNWEYIKYLPHAYSSDRKIRLFAVNEDESKQVTSYLDQIYQERVVLSKNSENGQGSSGEEYYKNFSQYFLIITDNYVTTKRYGILDKIMDSEKNYGFSLFTIEPTMQNIPSKCNKFISVNSGNSSLLDKDLTDESKINFIPEHLNVDIKDYAQVICNIPIASADQMASLPTSISFLEMFHVGKIEQLNILNRWKTNNPTISLHTTLGVHDNGRPFEIDLHEKYHGPHGLIAGSTGSGKSEFIITFILSMAINYHPYEVQFVIIDYKGGGLAGAFENRETGVKIPHLAGTITNLDVSEMHRTLVSINSELKRRQRMFNEARDALGESTVDIYKYQRFYREGKVKEPISHLFIISDEFAELKAQQPDFMDELVSAARIGRSLGVHLILATQKPSGVVDDQIWSNSKFKICLKVQTTEDSEEMLKRPEAASIKETGRFYLQVGYNELFDLGQSGWAGARYIPTERIVKSIDDSIDFIDNNGNIISKINDEETNKLEKQADLGDQLTNLVKTLYDIAIKEKIEFKKLWLENVPKVINYQNIINKYKIVPKVANIDPVIGEYDDPSSQKQGYFSMNLSTLGNTFISGVSGSGKTTLLSTMIYSTITSHNSDEVNIYILDFGAEKLKVFQQAPQVGEVLTGADNDKIKFLFYKLIAEMNQRKKYFSNNNSSFEKCIKEGKVPFPTILVIINNNDVFKEQFVDLYDDILPSIVRDCTKVGIIFVVSATTTMSLGYNIDNNFPQKIALKLNDPTDYVLFFDSKDMVPASNPGRGLIELDRVYEFQTCQIFPDDVYEKNLNFVFEELNKYLKSKAPLIPTVPNQFRVEEVLEKATSLDNIPIGININTAQISYFDFSKLASIITSLDFQSMKKFIQALVKLLSNMKNNKIILLNSNADLNISVPDGVKYYDTGFKQISPVLSKNIDKYNNSTSSNDYFIIIVIGYAKLQSHLEKAKAEDSSIDTINDLIMKTNNSNFKYILFDTEAFYPSIKSSPFFDLCDTDTGIWIGKGFDSQGIYEPDSSETKETKETGALIKGDNIERIKYIQ